MTDKTQPSERNLLTEGGAGGHMRHPFDIMDVKDGHTLIKKFEQIAKEIEGGNLPDTKIDGTNTSIKVINGEQFAMDRGSSKPIDVEGITVDRLPERFKPDPETGKEHGMVPAGKNVLGIFNEDFDNIKPELETLGMLNDPTKFFNMEYVKGTTNVLAYDHDFLKIHGVSQFYEKNDRRGNRVRPGLERPINKETNKPIKDPSVPVAYDQSVMDALVEKLNKSAENYGFKVYSSIPSKATGGFDFSPVMSVAAPVTLSDGNVEEKTLGERLKNAKNRIGEKVQTADGRKPPAQGKEIYKAVLGASAQDTNADPQRQTPLDKLLANEEDYQRAIDGAVFWHATRLLGNIIMSNMEVDHPAVKGPATEHEGLVIRLFGDDFDTKITGEFILGGEATSFRAAELEPEQGAAKKITGLFPGSFKPPHAGHYSVIKAMQGIPDINQIVVLISAPVAAVRSSRVTPEKAKAIWETYLQADPIGVDVNIKISTHPSPIRSAYEYIEEAAENNEVVLLATSTADSNYYPQKTIDKSAAKNPNGNVQAKAFVVPACRAEGCDTVKKMSAGDMRKIIDKPEITEQEKQNLFAYMHPSLTDEQKEGILALLVGESPGTSADIPEEELEEASSMGGGNVGISAGAFAGLNVNKENDEERQRTKANEHNTNRETNYQYIPDERKKKMSVKQLLEEKQKLEEYALRKYIRNLIHNKVEEKEGQLAEEQRLRLYIRQILKEAKVEDTPTKSTGINKLINVLKVIIPQIEKAYKGLATDRAQRDSFIKHYVHAVINTLSPQKAMRTAYESADTEPEMDMGMPDTEPEMDMAPMAESLLREQEIDPDPSKYLDIGIRTEEEEAEEAATEEAEKKVAKTEEAETKKKDDAAFEDTAGDKQLFPEIPGLDLTGRDEAIEIYKKTIAAITRAYATLHNDRDEKHFEDYLVTNILLYKDAFEGTMATDLPDITTPELEAARAEKEKYASPSAAPAPAPVEEIIKSAIADLISKQLY